MSFLMLLQISLKFWQMCKNSLAIISGTPQFFIRHVNNTRGKWNCHCRLTLRLTGRQGRCVLLPRKSARLASRLNQDRDKEAAESPAAGGQEAAEPSAADQE